MHTNFDLLIKHFLKSSLQSSVVLIDRLLVQWQQQNCRIKPLIRGFKFRIDVDLLIQRMVEAQLGGTAKGSKT